jgi:MYXO-CTERM domain-containing protein
MPQADVRTGDTRRDPRGLLALAALLLLLRVGVTVWEEHRPPAPTGSAMNWVEPQAAVVVAQQSGRPVLYEFGAAWCGPCQALNRDLFDDAARARALGNLVVPVSITDRKAEDGHNSALADSLQRAFSVNGFPTLVVWSPQTGRHVSTSGYGGDPNQVLNWVASGAMQVRLPSSAAPALPVR